MYVCINCQKRIEVKNANPSLSCPKCSGRILFKETPEIKKTILCR
ncbi:MAG: DNA-directed RNA polymerase subunit P [Candidatus Aenigmarchaeota archaeon]|nr:DNA-directed RNA polymerase subunit P [Candidatus Aenigmarchaeota archaeon]